MQLIKRTELRLLLADEGKHIRDVNDVYVEEHYDEDGNLVPAHEPHYSEMIFLGKQVNEKDINKMYVEESIN